MQNISNVATPDVAFVRIVNKAEQADGAVMSTMTERGFTELTFTSPKAGGLLSPTAWETMRQMVAVNATGKDKKSLLTRAEKAAFKLDKASFTALQKRSSLPVREARQADRTSAGQKVGAWISTRKAKAAENDKLKAGHVKAPARVKPLQERVNVHVNKALGQIAANADKTNPDSLKNQAKVVELLKELAKLTKTPARSVKH